MEITKNRLRHFDRMQVNTDLLEESQTAIIPDTNPDAMGIVGVHTWLNVQEKGCVQGVLRISGQVNCTICYLSAENQMPCTVSAVVPFSLVREVESMGEEDRLLASVRVLNGTALMINPRKLQVKVQLQAVGQLYQNRTIEYIEEITEREAEGVQCLSDVRKVCVAADIIEKRLVLNDEIRLSSALPNQESLILRKESDWVTEDIRLLQGKIMVRGHVDVRLTTMGTQGAFLGTSRYSVPFSQIIESSSIDPEDLVELNYAPVREEVELVTDDDVTTMVFSFAAIVTCIVKKTYEVRAVCDVYSTQWEMREEWTEFATLEERPEHRVTLAVKERILLENCAAEILEISVSAEDAAVSRGEQTVGVGFHLWVVYKEVDGTVATACKKIYGEVQCPASLAQSGYCRVEVREPSAVIVGEDEVQVSFEGIFCCTESSGPAWRIIRTCAIEPSKNKGNTGRPSLILRPANENETVWSLAKAYNTVPSILASANKLGREDVIPAGRMILIPFVDR